MIVRVFRVKGIRKLTTGTDMALGYVSPIDFRPVFRELRHWQGGDVGTVSPPYFLAASNDCK